MWQVHKTVSEADEKCKKLAAAFHEECRRLNGELKVSGEARKELEDEIGSWATRFAESEKQREIREKQIWKAQTAHKAAENEIKKLKVGRL